MKLCISLKYIYVSARACVCGVAYTLTVHLQLQILKRLNAVKEYYVYSLKT